MTLEEAWTEFRENEQRHGIHVSVLEASWLLRRLPGGQPATERTVEEETQGRFLDWLLYTKREKALAYEYLRMVGTVMVGPRQYWATNQAGRRAIAWESVATYPDSDSEIWDVIMVDSPGSEV